MNRVWRMAGVVAWAVCLAAGAAAQEPAAALTEPEILSFLESRVPEAFEMLTAARTNDPEGYRKQLQELGEQIAFYQETREHSPAFAESLLRAQYVAIKSRSLSGQIRGMGAGAERDGLVEELRGLLEEQFELQMQRPEMEIEFLEREVNRLKQRIEQQKRSRDTVVELRLRSLTGEERETVP